MASVAAVRAVHQGASLATQAAVFNASIAAASASAKAAAAHSSSSSSSSSSLLASFPQTSSSVAAFASSAGTAASAPATSYSELSAPLSRAQLDAALAALPVVASAREPLLYKSLPIDERLPVWINNLDTVRLGARHAIAGSRSIWKQTGYNYFTMFGTFGLVKMRMPFVAIVNPFNAAVEISPHPEAHAEQRIKRLRVAQEALLQTMTTKLDNNVNGCMFRYKRLMKLVGMGYRIASVAPHPTHPEQRVVEFQLGRSHLIPFALPACVQIKVLTKRGTVFRLLSTDFEAMQTVAMGIRQLKPPETYTGKGVVFWGETVVKKEGKKK